MSERLKSLARVALFAVLAMGAPAMAAPNQCDVVCSCSGSCNWLCSDGTARTNCGTYGICSGTCRTGPQTSQNEARESDAADRASQQVCGEKAPETSSPPARG
ncbi:hypothetical protein KRR26_03150 [Corallococcus sp. M34]|uniref:hypothetical protein n=1 Tax=Citreicoccus inhibens TaxID=2849499 RepID=UPI0011C4ACE5|nr:hypothetical protein [Citreicoccus inhibens]MBU8894582.1 hypothetical protein [Citreicoccus inhibens]